MLGRNFADAMELIITITIRCDYSVEPIQEEPQLEDAESENAEPVNKEHPVLSESSLCTLALTLKQREHHELAMRLNVPTVTIVRIKAAAEQLRQPESYLAQQYLLAWKQCNSGAKDRLKISMLEKGFRQIIKEEVADVVRDCANTDQEITAEMLHGLI